jgi:hypothetical protein
MKKNFPVNYFQFLGILFFGSLFILSWIFFKERMLNYDPAFFSFRILYDKTFDIELGRWGSVLSQLLPLWFLKSGSSLETFLKAYSVSFILIYYFIFLIITIVLKNNRAGIILMLALCLAFRHAFYYPTAELYQGIALCVLVWALTFPETEYQSRLKKNITTLVTGLLIFALSYYHQILVFPLLFIFVYHIIAEKKYFDKHVIGLVILTATWFFIRVKYLTTTTYEKDKIPELNLFFSQLGNLSQTPSFIYFKYFAKHFLWSLIFLNMICLGALVYNRRWPLLVFYVLFNAAFIYLNLITYRNGESPVMYENYLTLLGLFCAVPLSSLLLNFKYEKLRLPLTMIILIINVYGIYSARYMFSDRVAYLDRITSEARKLPEKKYIIESRNFSWKHAWVSWAFPFETLLSSSLQSPDSAISICVAQPINQYDSIINWENIFIGPPWSPIWFWTNNLDPHYFNLPEGNYKKIATSQSDFSFTERVFTNSNIAITAKENFVTLSKDSFTVVPITIHNTSGFRINSIPDSQTPVVLSYHVYDDKGKEVVWNGFRTPLETDIDKEATVGLVIKNDLEKGSYTCQIDFITEDIRWWNINAKIKLKVN